MSLFLQSTARGMEEKNSCVIIASNIGNHFFGSDTGPDVLQKESVHLVLEKGLRAFSNPLKMMPD